MKSFGDATRLEPQTDAERETLAHVIEIATAFERGDLGIESAMAQTTREDRQFAIRCLAGVRVQTDARKRAVMALLDGCIRTQDQYETKHGTFSKEALAHFGAKIVTNWEGNRVIVFPLCWMHGEPVYPPYRMRPGEERRDIERKINEDYQKYRDQKRGARPR